MELDDIIASQRVNQGNLNVAQNINENADKYAKDLGNANALGVSVDTYRQNINEYNARITQEAIDLANAGPVMQEFFADRERQALIANEPDEYERLGHLEGTFAAFKDGMDIFDANNVQDSLKRRADRVADPVGALMNDMANDDMDEDTRAKMAQKFQSRYFTSLQQQELKQMYKEARELALMVQRPTRVKAPKVLEEISNAEGFTEIRDAFLKDPLAVLGYTGGSSIGQQWLWLLASVPAYAVGAPVGAAVSSFGGGQMEYQASLREYAQNELGYDFTDPKQIMAFMNNPEHLSAADKFASARQEGVVFWDYLAGLIAPMNPQLMAGGRALGRQLGRAITGRTFVPLKPTRISSAISAIGAKSPYISNIDSLLSQATVGGVLGAAGEYTAQQNAGQETNWGDVFLEAVGEFFTMPVEAGFAHLGVAMNHIKQRQRAAIASKVPAVLEGLAKVVANSTLRTRSPEEFKATVQKMAGDGALKEVYVKPGELSQTARRAIASISPEVAQSMERAEAEGGVATIPMADLLTALTNDESVIKELSQHVRVRQDGMSSVEASQWLKENQSFLQRHFQEVYRAQVAKKEFREELNNAVKPMVEQLNVALRETMAKTYAETGTMTEADALKRADEVTTYSMRVFGQQLAHVATLAGMTPSQWMERYPNQVKAAFEALAADAEATALDQRVSPAKFSDVAINKGLAEDHRYTRKYASIEDMKRSEKSFSINLSVMESIPGMKGAIKRLRNPEKKTEAIIERMVDNLLWIYNQMPEEVRNRARLWYEGGHKSVILWANRYGIKPRQTAAILAVFSPRNNWFNNFTNAERTMDIYFSDARDFKPDDKLKAKLKELCAGKDEFRYAIAENKSLDEILKTDDLRTAAIWIRAYDEVFHDQRVRVQTPEGGVGNDWFRTERGTLKKCTWMDYHPIIKALSILRDGSMANIDAQLGDEFKVRDFYNNLYDPTDAQAMTIDTHQVGANLLSVMSSKSREVEQNFGGTGASSSSETGQRGTYAFYAEALSRAAERCGVMPREMQSISWEGIRVLFEDTKKKALRPKIEAIWKRHDKGEITVDQARQEILEVAGGFSKYQWEDTPFNDVPQPSYERGDVNLVHREEVVPEPVLAIEAAPDPRNAEAVAKWDELTADEKYMVTKNVVAYVLDRVALATKTRISEVGLQVGGWLGDVNFSATAEIADGGDAVGVAKLVARLLHQQSVMVISGTKQEGMFDSKVITIKLPDGMTTNQIGDFYKNYIDSVKGDDGKAMVKGMSTANGFMRIVLDKGDDSAKIYDALIKSIEGYPGDVTIVMSDAFVSFASGEDANGSESSQGVPEGLAASRNDHYDSLQGQVDQYFNEQVERAKANRQIEEVTQPNQLYQGQVQPVVVEATSAEVSAAKENRTEFRNAVKKLIADQFPEGLIVSVQVESDGREVLISKRSAFHSLDNRATWKTMLAVLHLYDLVKNSVRKSDFEDNPHEGDPNRPDAEQIIGGWTYQSKIRIDGTEHAVNIRIARHSDGKDRVRNAKVIKTPDGYLEQLPVGTGVNRSPLSGESATIIENADQNVKRFVEFAQTAWHGSPYVFDMFSLEHIGSGEGAQAHGWGLYFALNRKTAEGYRSRLADEGAIIKVKNYEFDENDMSDESPDVMAYHTVAWLINEAGPYSYGDFEDIRAEAINIINNAVTFGADKEDAAKAIELVKALTADDVVIDSSIGRLYEVDIPEDVVMLDEDKAFKDQSEFVKKAVRELYKKLNTKRSVRETAKASVAAALVERSKIVESIQKMVADGVLEIDGNQHPQAIANSIEWALTHYLERALNRESLPLWEYRYRQRELVVAEIGLSGSAEAINTIDFDIETLMMEAEQAFGMDHEDMPGAGSRVNLYINPEKTGLDIYDDLTTALGSPKEASLALNSVGIKGIRYDGRRDGPCAVVFDDEAIQILEFYQAQMNEKRRAAYNPSEGVTRLFESADESSFVHESAHYWLNSLALLCGDIVDLPVDNRTPGEQQLLEILDGFLKWGNIEGNNAEERIRRWNSMTLDEQRDFHEQFARGYEAYLRRGKAPTSGLRKAFEMFTEWLKRIYADASELNVEMSDEVAALYDRLFMAEAEAESVKQDQHIISIFPSARAAGMSDEDFAKLQEEYRAVQNAIEASIRANRQRNHLMLRDRFEREKRNLQGKYEQILNKQRKTLEKDPVYVALNVLTEPFEDNGATFYNKLSLAEVRRTANEDTAIVDAIQAKGLITNIGQRFIPIQVLADMVGAPNAKDLLIGMADALPMEEEAVERADAEFMRLYGNQPDDDGIGRAALVALAAHDPAFSNVLEKEYNALAKLTGGKKLVNEGARMYATKQVGEIPVKNLMPLAHARAEARAGKDAQKAFNDGDLVSAAIHKRNQVVQHHIARAGYEARAEIAKGLTYVKRVLKSKTVWGSYMEQIENLVARFNMAKIEYNNQAKDIKEFIADEEIAIDFDDFITNREDPHYRVHYSELSVDEFREVIDSIKALEKLGREKDTVIKDGQRQKIKEVVEELNESIGKNATAQGKTFKQKWEQNTPGAQKKQGLLRFVYSHVKIASMARIMDGDTYGAMWNTLIKRANECGDKETDMRAQLTQVMQKILEPVVALGGMHTDTVVLPGTNRPLTRQERIAFALNWGNDGNRQRLKDGFGINDQQAEVILRSLSTTEWRAVEKIWQVFETLRPQMEALEVRIYGRAPRWIEYAPFDVVTKEGRTITVSGGYYPAVYDTDANERSQKHQEMKAAEGLMNKAVRAVATDRSHMKKRSAKVMRPMSLRLSHAFDALNNEVHDICWREFVIDTQKIMNGGLAETITGYYDPDIRRQFRNWLSDIAMGDQRPREGCEAWLSYIRQGVGLAGLGFNVVSALSQMTGLLTSATRLGSYVGVGVGQYVKNPVGMAREVAEASLFMKNRGLTRFRELNEVNALIRSADNKPEQWMDAMRSGGYLMLLKVQQVVDTITWLGGYQQAIDNGASIENARAMADQVVIDTQGSGMLKDLSEIERQHWLKIFTVFYSFMNNAFNLNVTALVGDRNRYRAAAKILTMSVVMPTIEGLLRAALPVVVGDDDDEDETTLAMMGKAATDVASFNLGLFVGVRELQGMANAFSGGPIWNYQGPSGLRLLGDITKAGQQVAQGEFDAALAKSLVNLGGSMFGLPAAQINRAIATGVAYEEGDIDATDIPQSVLFGVSMK